MTEIIVILAVITVLSIMLYINTKTDAEMYENLYNSIKQRYFELEYKQLRSHLNGANIFTPEVLDALKYARKRSHPDNGGSDQEFKKYNKIYEDFLRKANIN